MLVHLNLEAISAPPPVSKSNTSTRKTLHALSLALAKSKRVIVVTGAGISCSSGIPDFRSSDGLYALVKSRYPDVVLKGRDLFSASLFREPESTRLFYSFIAELKSVIDRAHPGPTHRFIKTLDSKGKLLRSYTQNIDGFEEKAGIHGAVSLKGKTKKFNAKDTKNVQLHGDIHRVRCIVCTANFVYTAEYLVSFREGKPPHCPECSSRNDARQARNARPLAIGSLRPAIVLYDEPHPLGEEIGTICSSDMTKKPDMLIIMGTSLKVHGIKRLVKDFASAVHASSKASEKIDDQSSRVPSAPSLNLLTTKNPRLVVFVNRTPPPADLASMIDYWVEGETDAWVQKCEADWRSARPQDWEVQKTLFDVVSTTKNSPLVEGSNTWQVLKEGRHGTGGKSKAGAVGKGNGGSENAIPTRLPDYLTASRSDYVVSPFPKPKSYPKATHPTLVPLPSSPKRSKPSHQLFSEFEASDNEHEQPATQNLPLDVPSSPKKQRMRDGRAKPVLSIELPQKTTLFGARKASEDISLDDAELPPAAMSRLILPPRAKFSKVKSAPLPPRPKVREEHDMSLDDIRVTLCSGTPAVDEVPETDDDDDDDDAPPSSQNTIITRNGSQHRRLVDDMSLDIDPFPCSSQETVVEPAAPTTKITTKPQRKIAPTGGVTKRTTRSKTKDSVVGTKTRLGSGSSRDPIRLDI